MTDFTFDTDAFSDFYKDVNGFRPRGHEFYAPETSDERRQEIWDQLLADHDAEMVRYYAAQEEGKSRFEADVKKMIAFGAADRETAIRWMADAVDGGKDYLEYSYNLPYGYLLHAEVA